MYTNPPNQVSARMSSILDNAMVAVVPCGCSFQWYFFQFAVGMIQETEHTIFRWLGRCVVLDSYPPWLLFKIPCNSWHHKTNSASAEPCLRFGCEMRRMEKKKNGLILVDWLDNHPLIRQFLVHGLVMCCLLGHSVAVYCSWTIWETILIELSNGAEKFGSCFWGLTRRTYNALQQSPKFGDGTSSLHGTGSCCLHSSRTTARRFSGSWVNHLRE